MDGEGIIWLIAVGWVILSWIMKAIKGAAGQAGSQPGTVDDKPDAHDLRERRARLRAERARRKRLGQIGSPQDTALSDFRRELERVMGVHVEDEHGPVGRRATVGLESDEEVEERDSLEEDPVVVSLETGTRREARENINQDEQAAALLQHRRAVAEAHSRPHVRADHHRFDAAIRAPKAPAPPAKARQSMRQAFIWAEILGKPVIDR